MDKRTKPMTEAQVRAAERSDLARITEIYNYYIQNTPVTFDVEAYTVERREAWLAQFSASGRYRLIVAEANGIVIGYAATTRFRQSRPMKRRWRHRFIVRLRRWDKAWVRVCMRSCLNC